MDAPADEIEVVAERADPEDAPAQITVIPVDERLGPAADVATAVELAPGAVVRRLGGLGDWSSVSIRGSTARQVEVFLDGVPLNPEGGAATNLAELPLVAFERVEVVRGGAPLALDTAAMGGAVNLVTGEARGLRGQLAAGSWSTARGTLWSSGPLPVGELLVAVDGLATAGTYPVLDDGGTPTDPADDAFRPRENNDTRQVSGIARWRTGDRVRLSLSDAFLARDEGVPGPTFAPTGALRYAVTQHLPVLELRSVAGSHWTSARAWGVLRAERLDDPEGEVGSPGATATDTSSAGVRLGAGGATSPGVAWELMASGRQDLLAGEPVRQVGRAGAEGTAHAGPLVASGQLRALTTAGDGWLLPRFALGVHRGAWRAKLGVGRGVRVPDLTELYGHRGGLVGNPGLEPERSVGADATTGWTGDRGRAEVGVFLIDSRDRIVWSRNAQGLSRPDNLDRARLAGVELGASGSRGPLELWLGATFTSASNRSMDPAYRGRQLPWVPWVEGTGRIGWVIGDWTASTDLSVTAGTFADATNYQLQAPRLLQGALLRWSAPDGPWGFALDVRNLLNTRVAQGPRDPLVDDGVQVPRPLEDFAGQPLPGRTVTGSVRIQR